MWKSGWVRNLQHAILKEEKVLLWRVGVNDLFIHYQFLIDSFKQTTWLVKTSSTFAFGLRNKKTGNVIK
jgi:hypothetical protein